MSEMLGNQYFLARKYKRASEKLEKALLKYPGDKGIRRKLIVCYVQINETKRALDIFSSIVENDIYVILNCDPASDDCPCPELVTDMEAKLPDNQDSVDFFLNLAMLWLYCDLKKSLFYFKKAHQLGGENRMIINIISILTAKLKNKEKN